MSRGILAHPEWSPCICVKVFTSPSLKPAQGVQVPDHGGREAWHPCHRLQEDDPRQDGPLVQGLQVALNGVSGGQVEAVPGICVQRGDLSFVRGLVKFLLALAYLFCLALLGSCLTRFAKNKSPLCTAIQYLIKLSIHFTACFTQLSTLRK